jgi:hypothetical protein
MDKGVTITCMKKLWLLENTIHGGYRSQGPNFICEVNILIFLLDLLFVLFESWFLKKLFCVLFDFIFPFVDVHEFLFLVNVCVGKTKLINIYALEQCNELWAVN